MSERRVKYRSKLATEQLRLSILDEELLDHLDVFYLILLRICHRTLLPEILEAVGRENFIKFLDIFKGTTVRVPSAEVLHEAARDAIVYATLEREKDEDSLSYLGKRYDLSKQDLLTIHKRVAQWKTLT